MTFESDRAALAIDARDLDLPISGHNSELHDTAARYLDATYTRSRRDTCRAQVRQTIEQLLGTGTCNCQHVADALHMHPRTLQRRLREEGASFEEIKDEMRRDLAQRYLAHPEVPLYVPRNDWGAELIRSGLAHHDYDTGSFGRGLYRPMYVYLDRRYNYPRCVALR